MIEAQAWSVQTSDPGASQYARGDRVFHQKFGYGRVSFVEGNKLTVEFDKAGEKARHRPVRGAGVKVCYFAAGTGRGTCSVASTKTPSVKLWCGPFCGMKTKSPLLR